MYAEVDAMMYVFSVCIHPQQGPAWKGANLSFPNPLYNYSPDANGTEHKSSEA